MRIVLDDRTDNCAMKEINVPDNGILEDMISQIELATGHNRDDLRLVYNSRIISCSMTQRRLKEDLQIEDGAQITVLQSLRSRQQTPSQQRNQEEPQGSHNSANAQRGLDDIFSSLGGSNVVNFTINTNAPANGNDEQTAQRVQQQILGGLQQALGGIFSELIQNPQAQNAAQFTGQVLSQAAQAARNRQANQQTQAQPNIQQQQQQNQQQQLSQQQQQQTNQQEQLPPRHDFAHSGRVRRIQPFEQDENSNENNDQQNQDDIIVINTIVDIQPQENIQQNESSNTNHNEQQSASFAQATVQANNGEQQVYTTQETIPQTYSIDTTINPMQQITAQFERIVIENNVHDRIQQLTEIYQQSIQRIREYEIAQITNNNRRSNVVRRVIRAQKAQQRLFASYQQQIKEELKKEFARKHNLNIDSFTDQNEQDFENYYEEWLQKE